MSAEGQGAEDCAPEQQLAEQKKEQKAISDAIKNRPKYICADCGATQPPVSETKGSIGVELMLWLFFLVPGIIYSLWRVSSRYNACPVCKGAHMIPVASPKGKQLYEQLNP